MEVTRSLLIVLFLSVVLRIESARILAYFPTPSVSHQVVFRPLVHELAKRGHEVVVVTTDPAFSTGKAPANLTEIDVHDISYNMWGNLLKKYNTGMRDDVIHQIKITLIGLGNIFDQQIESRQVKNVLKNKDKKYFDLLLLEAWSRPLMGLANIFEAPVIIISSFGAVPIQYNFFGAPTHPLLYPTPGRQRSYNLTLLEKGLEIIKDMIFEYSVSTVEENDLKIANKHFGDLSFKDLNRKIKMMFLNEHPIWADNRPVPSGVIYIGGIHQSEKKELPKDLKAYLDSSTHGVIYVSFGTNVLPSLLPPEKIEIMTKVFSKLPYNILWKWDKDVLPGQSDNIKISKWFPQIDLLKHPNIKLFITQGGLQSTDETIDAAVPVIGIPMIGDQWYNVEKYVLHKIGHLLDITTLTEEQLKTSIETVIENKSYKENILKLKTLMREYPVKPLDHAVWWTEHVIKYGGDHLQSPAADMLWAEYYELNLITFVLLILSGILAALILIIRKINSLILKLFTSNSKLKIN